MQLGRIFSDHRRQRDGRQFIGRTREIDAVIVRGRYYSGNDLDLLEDVAKRAAGADVRK